MIRRSIALTLVVTTTWISTWAAAPVHGLTTSQSLPNERSLSHLDHTVRLIEEVRSNLDRSQFDLEALNDRLNWDPLEIVAFVTHEIHYEQYPGLLRGAEGTLMSRAGNSLDQAVLLATLLRDAGLDARIPATELHPDQVHHLLSQIQPRTADDQPLGDTGEIQSLIGKIQGLEQFPAQRSSGSTREKETVGEIEPDPELDSIFQQVLNHEELISTLANTKEYMEGLSREARDYYWVEYKPAANSDWIPVHPAIDSGSISEKLQPLEYFAKAIPPRLQHRVSLQAFISRSSTGGLETVQIMDDWQMPVANLIGEPVTFSLVPDGLYGVLKEQGIENGLALEDGLNATRIFSPFLDGDPAPGGMSFTEDGFTVDPIAAFGASASFFAELTGKANRAAGALGSLGVDKPKGQESVGQQLDSCWLEVSTTGPGGLSRTERVWILEPASSRSYLASQNDAANSENWNIKLDLFEDHTFMLSAGEVPQSYVLDRVLGAIMDTWVAFESLPANPNHLTVARSLVGLNQPFIGHLNYFLATDLATGGLLPSGRVYRSGPHLLDFKRRFPSFDRAELVADVLMNPRRAFSVAEQGAPEPVPVAPVVAGILDTRHEQLVTRRANDDGRWSAFETLAAIASSSNGVKWTTPSHLSDPPSAFLNARASINVQEDLENGFSVLYPASTNTGEQFAWWRFNPKSGEALGISESGEGVSASEYKVVAIVVVAILSVTVGALTYAGCVGDSNEEWKIKVCAGCGLLAGGAMFITGILIIEGLLAASFPVAGAEAAVILEETVIARAGGSVIVEISKRYVLQNVWLPMAQSTQLYLALVEATMSSLAAACGYKASTS